MGKNNKEKDRYERVDLSGSLGGVTPASKMASIPHRDTPNRGPRQGGERKIPEVPAAAIAICNTLSGQADKFVSEAQSEGEVTKDMQKDLFFLGKFGDTLSLGPDDKDLIYYPLSRSIRTTRDDNPTLIRASINAVLVDAETKEPVFYIDAFVNANFLVNVTVAPIDRRGVDYRAAARWSNRGND